MVERILGRAVGLVTRQGGRGLSFLALILKG